MGNTNWTTAEIERLQWLAGDYHIKHLTTSYNRWAVRNGYKNRSDRALKHKIYQLGLSIKPEGQWLMLMDVARILGRSDQTIRDWADRGWIPAEYVQRPSRRTTMINRRGLDRLARTRPQVFAGCSLYALLATLGSEPLAEELHEQLQGRRWASQDHPVLCVETGQRYPSVQAAARAHYVTANTIRYALQKGWRAADKHWQSLRPDHAPVDSRAAA